MEIKSTTSRRNHRMSWRAFIQLYPPTRTNSSSAQHYSGLQVRWASQAVPRPIQHAEEQNTQATCNDAYLSSISLFIWAPSWLSGSFTSLSQRYGRRATMGWEPFDGCYGWIDGWMVDDDEDDDRQSWWWQPIIKLNYIINEIIGFKKERVRYLIISIRTKFI